MVEYKKSESKNLFVKCRLQVCNFLAEAMHDIQLAQMEKADEDSLGRTAEDILVKVSKVLGFENTKTFLTVSFSLFDSNEEFRSTGFLIERVIG